MGKGETPLMQQHNAIKAKYPDAVLLFRVGDFYETFGNDAIVASKVLGIALTKRNNGNANSLELAGFPHHSLETYLHKLVKAGHRVAICDQLEDPKQAKGIVKRGVTELVTPGTATNDKILDVKQNNFLACVHIQELEHGIAILDISTGEFFVAQGSTEYIDKLLQSFKPSEVVFAKKKKEFFFENFGDKFFTYLLDEWIFTDNYANDLLLQQFQVHSLKGFGIDSWQSAIVAAGAAIHYLKDTEHPNIQHLNAIQRITQNEFMWMDRFTVRNLELMQSNFEGGNSLAQVLDETVSPMGSRLLKRWILFPLQDIIKINERLDAVDFFIQEKNTCSVLSECIKQTGDIERLVARIPMKKIMPREVLQLAKGLAEVEKIKTICTDLKNNMAVLLADKMNACEQIQKIIFETINEDAPNALNKGNLIKAGLHAELDELRNISTNGKDFLTQILQREQDRTSISSLKLSFNNVFGYYLEVTNTHKDKVPSDWIRKQTLSNAERYITPELKEYEEKILGAEEKIISLEQKLYDDLISKLQEYIIPIQLNAQLVAQLDCIFSFVQIATKYNYNRPIVNNGNDLMIVEGRHPVIERNLPIGEDYISNDVMLNKTNQQIIIITGPNMSGKSALLRQTALIIIMAHIGCYVPALKADIGLCDKIFTRVGASDNLSGGESTFMVEMNETASIINNISERSFIILDEIGRGTSTFDGISIAWSIVEYLFEHKAKPKTLFATHYHELNELENNFEGIKNYHITHKEVGNKVIFLRKLALGGSRHSFGIHVAKMAGMPNNLVDRANEILALLEEKNINDRLKTQIEKIKPNHYQLNIFDGLADDLKQIKNVLEGIEINSLTPVEALMKLNELKGIVKVK